MPKTLWVKSLKTLAFSFILSSSLICIDAFAQEFDLIRAKSIGLVGEQVDGYLGIVRAIDNKSQLQAEIDQINIQRLALYRQRTPAGANVDFYAAQFGRGLVDRAGVNEFVRGVEGQWFRKADLSDWIRGHKLGCSNYAKLVEPHRASACAGIEQRMNLVNPSAEECVALIPALTKEVDSFVERASRWTITNFEIYRAFPLLLVDARTLCGLSKSGE